LAVDVDAKDRLNLHLGGSPVRGKTQT